MDLVHLFDPHIAKARSNEKPLKKQIKARQAQLQRRDAVLVSNQAHPKLKRTVEDSSNSS